MTLVVKKFGGTSLATPELILNVAKKIAAARAEGKKVAVVLSAMAGETDRLLKMAASFSDIPPPAREQDAIVSTGEQVSCALMAVALESLGCPARSFTGAQLPLITDDSFTKARILEVGRII
jgi:aspartate kinase